MKIAIPVAGNNLDSLLEQRFGRCSYFIIADSEHPDSFKLVPNRGASAFRGAGVLAAQSVASQEAEAVITPNIGPNSFSVLRQAGIKIFRCPPGKTVKEAISLLRQGQLPEFQAPIRDFPGRRRFHHGRVQ